MRTQGTRGHLFAIWRLSPAAWALFSWTIFFGAFFAATAWSAPRVNLVNRIERVEVVQDSPRRFAITIQGSLPPNFSTLELSNPPRLLLDIEGAIIGGARRQTRFERGPVRQVTLTAHGSGKTSMVRASIAFEAESEVDLEVRGAEIAIRPSSRGVLLAATPQALTDGQVTRTRVAKSAAGAGSLDRKDVVAVRGETGLARRTPSTPARQPLIDAPPPDPTPTRATVERIGFKLLPEAARVTVRLTQEAIYTAGETSPGVVTIILHKTRLGSANNRHPLETSYFGTALQRVVPGERDGDVRLELHLDRAAGYQVRQRARELQIDVER